MKKNALIITFVVMVIYGYIYSLMNENDFNFVDPIDPYYFSLMTMSTVGFGDLSPKSRRAKLVVISQLCVIIAEVISLLSV